MQQRPIVWTISEKCSLWQDQIYTVRRFGTESARVTVSAGARIAVAVSRARIGVAATVPIAVTIVSTYTSALLLPWQAQFRIAIVV